MRMSGPLLQCTDLPGLHVGSQRYVPSVIPTRLWSCFQKTLASGLRDGKSFRKFYISVANHRTLADNTDAHDVNVFIHAPMNFDLSFLLLFPPCQKKCGGYEIGENHRAARIRETLS